MKIEFKKGFEKTASLNKSYFGKSFNPNKKNEDPIKVPKSNTKVTAVKPGIQHTSGYR